MNDMLLKEETHVILSCAMEVHNELGYGLLEKPYENSLVVEFGLRNIAVVQQRSFEVAYKDVIVGKFIPDLIVFDQIIVDTKVVDSIGKYELGQMINYLRLTGLRVGLIVNFKHAKLTWKRVIV